MPKSHLVIPDAHSKPGISNERFEWLAKYILIKKPDTIVCLGDFADMPSLSSYDVGKKSFEGRRYKDDVKSVKDAMNKLMSPIDEFNKQASVAHRVRYKPRLVLTLGNHEDRISRACNDDPKIDGTIGIGDLEYEKHGWEVLPYKQPICIDGISYCHFFTSGVMDRPISGNNAARSILNKKHTSCISGHSHLLDMAVDITGDGRRIRSLVAGCFFDHHEDYVSLQGNQAWWRGVFLLNEVHDGDYIMTEVSLNFLKSKFEVKNDQT